MWGCRSTNHKGKTLENIINNNNRCLFIICYLLSHWFDPLRVNDDTCGRDNFPIVLESLHPQDDDLPRWRLNKANWEEFRSQCQKQLIVNNTETILEFSEKLINIAKTYIPHNPTTHKRHRPRFSKECKQATRLRRTALRKFNAEPTTSILISFKFHRAKARKIIKEAKEITWQNYCALYVDDFVISHSYEHHHHIVLRKLQLNLNKVNKWERENGFKFSNSKIECVHFCSLRKMHNDLKIDESEILVVNEYKFLGVIFDKKNFQLSNTWNI